MYKTAKEDKGEPIGSIKLEDSEFGLLITPDIKNMPPGIHGFHVHENPNCGDNGNAAGPHLNPRKSRYHAGPYDLEGHLGDLPVLIVNQDGTATLPLLAPRLTANDVEKGSLMIHVGGDNYSDAPIKLGGGGARLACGALDKWKSKNNDE